MLVCSCNDRSGRSLEELFIFIPDYTAYCHGMPYSYVYRLEHLSPNLFVTLIIGNHKQLIIYLFMSIRRYFSVYVCWPNWFIKLMA